MIDITHPTGLGPLLTAPVYSATKHGLVGFTRSIAVRDSPMRLFKKIFKKSIKFLQKLIETRANLILIKCLPYFFIFNFIVWHFLHIDLTVQSEAALAHNIK